jgi:integrase/recombinase XerD
VLSDALFVSEEGRALSYRALARWFTTTCRQIGIEPVGGGHRPTLHALRHTFAVESIRRWYQEGVDVQALLPHLSVYLGHIRPQESYWYLSATPELLTAAAARFQHYAIRGESS